MTEWGGGDGRPAKVACPHCGKQVRGLKAHIKDKHRRPVASDDLQHLDGMLDDRSRES